MPGPLLGAWRPGSGLAGAAPVAVPLLPTALAAAPAPAQVKGSTDTVALLRLLRPTAYIPLLNAEFDQSGPLADLLVEEGGVAAVQAQLAASPELAGIRVCVPQAAQPMAVNL